MWEENIAISGNFNIDFCAFNDSPLIKIFGVFHIHSMIIMFPLVQYCEIFPYKNWHPLQMPLINNYHRNNILQIAIFSHSKVHMACILLEIEAVDYLITPSNNKLPSLIKEFSLPLPLFSMNQSIRRINVKSASILN